MQLRSGTCMLLVALGLAVVIGLALGLLGGGGSILTLPMLVYVLGLDPKEAIASSLFVVGVTSLVGVIGHARAGRVRWKVGALFGAAGMVGASLGGEIAPRLPGTLLLVLFACLMLLTGVVMLRPRRAPKVDTSPRALSIPKAALIGLAVGVISGLVGAGGGFLVVPALVLVGGLEMREAVGTSLLVIAMQALAGFASHARHTPLHLDWLAIVSAGSLAGSVAGLNLARLVSPDALRRSFGALVLAMGGLLLALQLPEEFMLSISSLRPLLGGALIGLSASLLLLTHGKIAGISGIYGGLIDRTSPDRRFRAWFVAGLLGAGALFLVLSPGALPAVGSVSLPIAALGGLLVGFGARLGNGCTSGHGVCGLSRLSARSLVATLTFMSTGVLAVLVARHLLSLGLGLGLGLGGAL